MEMNWTNNALLVDDGGHDGQTDGGSLSSGGGGRGVAAQGRLGSPVQARRAGVGVLNMIMIVACARVGTRLELQKRKTRRTLPAFLLCWLDFACLVQAIGSESPPKFRANHAPRSQTVSVYLGQGRLGLGSRVSQSRELERASIDTAASARSDSNDAPCGPKGSSNFFGVVAVEHQPKLLHRRLIPPA